MSDLEKVLTFEIASLQEQLNVAQKKVVSLKRLIRGLSKHLEELIASREPLTSQEFDNE